MPASLTIITNPKASSGLGVYIAKALQQSGCEVSQLDPAGSTWQKLWPVIRSWRWDKTAMWKARWENLVFSSRAWDRNTRRVGRQLEKMKALGRPILMVGKEYFPHPDYRHLPYSIFIHHTMRLALADGVTPWLPPPHDVERFLERETLLYQHARNIFVGGQFLADNLVQAYGVPPDRSDYHRRRRTSSVFRSTSRREDPNAIYQPADFRGLGFRYEGGGGLACGF